MELSMKKVKKKLPSLKNLKKILKLIEEHQIVEFEWERDGEKLHFKSKQSFDQQNSINPVLVSNPFYSPAPPMPASAVLPATSLENNPIGQKSNKIALAGGYKKIAAPMVGTFYSSPSPSSAPYVKEGQAFRKGDVLCIIEAMKLMNEIEAEFSGKVISILVDNGQPIEYGQELFVIEPINE
jgi:acetyl-CoA carboxylase biotin carboxyl carrier protein